MADTNLVVAAIDFGSHGSGYAFSFRHEFIANPVNINIPTWSSETGHGITYKTPSSILLDSKQKLAAFGHDAQDKYVTICENSEENAWYYLPEFKMKLYKAVLDNQDIRKDFMMKEINGKEISGKKVFSKAIKFLKTHLIKQFTTRNIDVDTKFIKWVITVPAIWNDACKQFMREAAKEAGIAGNKCVIVYEPEAASIYARLLPVDRFVGANKTTIQMTFCPGKKLIVVDAGGGTVDISAQEVLPDGHLKIIHKVCGGSWGGEWVNQEYRTFLKRLVGGDVLTEFKEKHGLYYNEMMRHFEVAKKSYRAQNNVDLVTKFPGVLNEILQEHTECSISDIIAQNSTFKGKVAFQREKLKIARDLFESFYYESVENTVKKLQNVLQDSLCSDVSAIMLVGGFSESPMLQKALKKALGLEVFIPLEGPLSVVKGAVIYGHDPNIITSRVCSYTYGVSISVPFRESEHPREKFYKWGDEDWCKHVFHVCFEEGQEVTIGQVERIEMNNTSEGEDCQIKRTQPFTLEIYISEQKRPKFVTDVGCRLHAKIHVDPPNGLWPVEAYGWVELEIAGAEMIGTYVSLYTDERISTRFEFLPSGYTYIKGERERLQNFDS